MSDVVSNPSKIIGIANRIKAAPAGMRSSLVNELLQAIDEGGEEAGESKESAIANLRNMLTWEEVRSCPRAMTNICRNIRKLRES